MGILAEISFRDSLQKIHPKCLKNTSIMGSSCDCSYTEFPLLVRKPERDSFIFIDIKKIQFINTFYINLSLSNFLITACTAFADLCKFAFSVLLSLSSSTRVMPFLPNCTGTPKNMFFNPYAFLI